MSKPIILTEEAWVELYQRLSRDNHSSVILIRTKMRAVLGFTVRRHRVWRHDIGGSYPVDQIHLDFYNEPKRTMFLLKYSDILSKEQKIDLRHP
jgi:hypothetical protein